MKEMQQEKHDLFDRIAGLYSLFFKYQTDKYDRLLNKIYQELELFLYRDAIDFGCGTGALCSELHRRGLRVTGVDASAEMLRIAEEKLGGEGVKLVRSNILEGVPFKDKSFDVSFASFVAHGLPAEGRKALYAEMRRVTKHMILIYDYNEKRSAFTDIAEYLEGGDYFNFIKTVKAELKEYFGNLREIEMEKRASCYIIKL